MTIFQRAGYKNPGPDTRIRYIDAGATNNVPPGTSDKHSAQYVSTADQEDDGFFGDEILREDSGDSTFEMQPNPSSGSAITTRKGEHHNMQKEQGTETLDLIPGENTMPWEQPIKCHTAPTKSRAHFSCQHTVMRHSALAIHHQRMATKTESEAADSTAPNLLHYGRGALNPSTQEHTKR